MQFVHSMVILWYSCTLAAVVEVKAFSALSWKTHQPSVPACDALPSALCSPVGFEPQLRFRKCHQKHGTAAPPYCWDFIRPHCMLQFYPVGVNLGEA